jgi:sugar (pentulose or hexulose) kinase
MSETGVLIDAAGQPCAPALAWYDTRADVATVEAACGGKAFRSATGLGLSTLPSLTKVLWLQQAVPGASRRGPPPLGRRVDRAPARRRGGGRALARLRTGLWDVVSNEPWPAAAELLGRSLLPTNVVVAGSATGRIGDSGPEPLRGAVLTVAGHDHQTAAFAAGAAVPGVLFDSLGTAEALLRYLRAPADDPALRAQVDSLAAQGVSVGRARRPPTTCACSPAC